MIVYFTINSTCQCWTINTVFRISTPCVFCPFPFTIGSKQFLFNCCRFLFTCSTWFCYSFMFSFQFRHFINKKLSFIIFRNTVDFRISWNFFSSCSLFLNFHIFLSLYCFFRNCSFGMFNCSNWFYAFYGRMFCISGCIFSSGTFWNCNFIASCNFLSNCDFRSTFFLGNCCFRISFFSSWIF